MRFSVIGTDAAGLTIEFNIDARNADEAEHIARGRGINVAKVWLGGGSTRASDPVAQPSASVAPVQFVPVAAVQNAPPAAVAAVRPPVSAPPQRTYTRVQSRPRINLGLASLALGGTALVFCWIPTVGIIAWPLCAIGLIAGVAGLIPAFKRSAAAAPSLMARIATPIGGLALSALTIAAGAVFAGATEGPDTAPAKPGQTAASSQPTGGLAPSAAAPEKKQRNLAIVAADKPDADAAVKAPAPPAVVKPVPPIEAIKVGTAELRTLSCEITPVPLVGDQGRHAGVTSMPLLVVRVEIRNTGDQPMDYSTLAGDDEAGLRNGCTLKDDQGRTLRRAQFKFSVMPAGHTKRETIYPGKSVTDVLAFERPASDSGFFTIAFNGRFVGATGEATLNVPAAVKK